MCATVRQREREARTSRNKYPATRGTCPCMCHVEIKADSPRQTNQKKVVQIKQRFFCFLGKLNSGLILVWLPVLFFFSKLILWVLKSSAGVTGFHSSIKVFLSISYPNVLLYK